ncbi:hypothetical protein Gohar_020139 [Gossypium harknessii]|uniref:Uncharacterized protein n=1 Tax=Gossypium harknessii TaxID=34285 RepID=A0A7J9HWU7_9ROSI|nr:hypothetical protein [Gossypium harknessii]
MLRLISMQPTGFIPGSLAQELW